MLSVGSLILLLGQICCWNYLVKFSFQLVHFSAAGFLFSFFRFVLRFSLSLSLSLFFCPCYATCGIWVLWPGIELGPLSMRVQCPNHETARKFLGFLSLLTFPLFISHIVSWLSLHSPLVLWIFSRLFKFFGIFAINVFFRDSFTDFFFFLWILSYFFVCLVIFFIGCCVFESNNMISLENYFSFTAVCCFFMVLLCSGYCSLRLSRISLRCLPRCLLSLSLGTCSRILILPIPAVVLECCSLYYLAPMRKSEK